VSAFAALFLEYSEHGGAHSRNANQEFTTLGRSISKNLFFRLQARIFPNRSESAAHPKF
jgi:hypothetical protein